jgi:hypothetical protein
MKNGYDGGARLKRKLMNGNFSPNNCLFKGKGLPSVTEIKEIEKMLKEQKDG